MTPLTDTRDRIAADTHDTLERYRRALERIVIIDHANPDALQRIAREALGLDADA